MKQLDAIYLTFAILSVLIAAFIVWLIVKNTEVRKGDKIYNLPNEIPGEGVDIRFSEQPYYEC